MFSFDATTYGDAVASLIPEHEPNTLGPGTPNHTMKPVLQQAGINSLFTDKSIADQDMAKCCLSALWLYHDFLDESHTISQSVYTSTGSYWHGIMHRREPDYSNAGYWFHKVGQHPIFDTLCGEASRVAQELGTTSKSDYLAKQSSWDAFAFIQLCENSYRTGSQDERLCENIQLVEWKILFHYSYTQSCG